MESEISFKELVITFKLKKNKVKEIYIKKNYLTEYNNILKYSLNINNNITWLEKVYNYVYDIKEIPKCKICGSNLSVKCIQKGYDKCLSNSCSKNKINVNNFTNIELKEWLTIDNKYGHKNNEKYFKTKYPLLYNKIIKFQKLGNWNEKLYNYINDIKKKS